MIGPSSFFSSRTSFHGDVEPEAVFDMGQMYELFVSGVSVCMVQFARCQDGQRLPLSKGTKEIGRALVIAARHYLPAEWSHLRPVI